MLSFLNSSLEFKFDLFFLININATREPIRIHPSITPPIIIKEFDLPSPLFFNLFLISSISSLVHMLNLFWASISVNFISLSKYTHSQVCGS